MATRRDRSDELRALARVLHRLMREHEIANHTRLKLTPPLQRILKLAPEYREAQRREEHDTRSAKDPSFFTLVDAAEALKVPICAFVPTVEHQPVTDAQRKLLTLAARWTLANFARSPEERGAYTSDFEDFEPYVTIQKLEYRSAAGSGGSDEQLPPEAVPVDASIPGIGSERFQVTTVSGDSMAERLRHGDRVLVDLDRRKPVNGEMVVVDLLHLGRTIGYWREQENRAFLDKENASPIALGEADDYKILGTITGIVWSPIGRRRSR